MVKALFAKIISAKIVFYYIQLKYFVTFKKL